MTYVRKDITDGFYSGNSKVIHVTIRDELEQLVDLDDAELTYVIFTRDKGVVVLRKSSYNGTGEIKVTGEGLCEIYLKPPDTAFLYGTFRHHLNVVRDNEEKTVLTGVISIHKAPAKRFRTQDAHAYLEGISS